jgi:DNA-binding SARP family transcriptional activator
MINRRAPVAPELPGRSWLGTHFVRFGVLGPLIMADADGQLLTLRDDRQRSLLAMLLFHANNLVLTERLVDALWPEVPRKPTRTVL